ncbi:MAG: beta-galactosidase [Candidatus Doudnabacteria bacterium]|nr:beta-galactosidase [Candidatus Doudnabacteria bacterium]
MLRSRFSKIVFTLVALLIFILAYFFAGSAPPAEKINWGVSFSPVYARSLGLAWKDVYLALLDELGVSHLRLASYWPEHEKSQGNYDFSDLDFMINEAAKRNRSVVLVVGVRQPRWPECHFPQWLDSFSEQEQDGLALEYVKQVVERYRGVSAIRAWQVENEFFVKWFGVCPPGRPEFLRQEIDLVKSLDSRPVILTDSGELSLWYKTAKQADIFGTTIYRKVYAPWGIGSWPYPPVYYYRLGKLVRFFTGFDRMIVTELQAEPWGKTTLVEDSTQTNFETLNPEQFRKNVNYARRTGIDEIYLWGAEWWYYMHQMRGVADYWDEAHKLWH